MNVLLVTSNFVTPLRPSLGGGSAAVAQDIATHLISEGHRVTVLRAERADLPSEIVGGIPVFSMPKRNIYTWTAELKSFAANKALWHAIEDRGPVSRSFKAILRDVRPDLVASHNIMGVGSQIWRVAARADIPSVHTLHDYYLLCPRTTRLRGERSCVRTCASCRLLTRVRRAETRHLAGVISVSRHLLDVHLADGIFADIPNRTVILNASDPVGAGFRRPEHGTAPLRIGFIGRGAVEKGLHVLIAAFEAIGGTDSRLIVAGGVPSNLLPAIAASPRRSDMTFLGEIPRDDFYAAVDVVVVPSIHAEPFSLVIAEAQARALPVIASRAGGMPEAMGGNRAGWLVPPGDVMALAGMLGKIVRTPAILITRGASGLKRSQTWTKADFLRAYTEVYQQTIARKVWSRGR